MAMQITDEASFEAFTHHGERGELAVLADRLERGWNLIQQRELTGTDVSELENHWFNLLHEYETLHDELNH